MARPRKYSAELRERAVRLYFESDRPIAHIAHDLGIHRESLRLWVRQAEADSGRRRDLLTTNEREELKRLRKENAELRRANEILKDASVYFATELDPTWRRGPATSQKRRVLFGVVPICRTLGVPVSTFYARRSRKPSRRALEDRRLLAEIYAARSGYRRVYGVRKTWKELRRRGIDAGRDRVARLMRAEGLEGVRRGKKRHTTIPDEQAAERARDLLQRDFAASAPNEKWVCDITYLSTWQGFCYLAFIVDCYSRALVGWQLATHLRTELVLDALEMATGLRRPDPGVIAHSDRGSQYTSFAYTDRLAELGLAPSVGSRGDAYDNALAEAWVATFKSELVFGRRFSSFAHAEHEVLHWIGFYNEQRLHEELGDLPPSEYEELNIRRDNSPILSAT
jgi:putative transposase